MLDIYAGKQALKTIQEQGFKQALFTTMLGASGGPKWFTLFALDKYLFGDFFKERTAELNLIGSSAGAFRFAALAQDNPVAAITRLADYYSHTVYSDKASSTEITAKALQLLDYVFDERGIEQILNNKIFKAHFIVSRCTGLTRYEAKPLQIMGLLASILLNRLNRGLLNAQYQRYVYQAPSSQIKITDAYQFETHYVDLTKNNLRQALLASGSIPLLMQGIKNIEDSPQGMYRDGGIIDYHFDVNIKPQDGLILYPHFSAQPKAGWFDKNLKRKVNPMHYQNTVMLVPSAKFVASLPFAKIPDRNDFTTMDATTRITYWQTVLAETERLAASLDEMINSQNMTTIKALP
ncbi:MAG: hypothetical protein ACI9LM_004117 [Alteromonadaceae bacterium]|jgi:hypothetical protein